MQYLVTSYSETRGCDRYFRTAKMSGCTPLVVQYGQTEDVVYPDHSRVYKIASGYPGNTARLISLFDLIRQEEFFPHDWFIFTDTHDVFFQGEVPNLEHYQQDVIVASEGRLFREIDFWDKRAPSDLRDQMAYNVGSFAMRKHAFMDFLLDVRKEWDKMRKWYTSEEARFPYSVPVVKDFAGSVFNSYADTFIFNRFIRKQNYIEAPEIISCAAFNLELGKMVKKDGSYYTADNQLIKIVHLNGSTGK